MRVSGNDVGKSSRTGDTGTVGVDTPAGGAPVTGTARQLERIAVGVVGLTARMLASAAQGAELTFQQWRAIFVVGESDDGARVGQVATRLATSLTATSRLLRRLETRGLLALATDEADRRATRARLTTDGRVIRTTIMEGRRTVLVGIADLLDATEVDAAVVLAIMEDALQPYL
jgi:DNA-binding MarR family transcriptional regulator